MKEIESFKLEVNDNEIKAKDFVQRFIGNTILGMIETLRIKDQNIGKINIKIEFDDKD